jgi:hypothetical protein
MPDITPTELERSGLALIGRELGAGLKQGLGDMLGLLKLGKAEDKTEDMAKNKDGDDADDKAKSGDKGDEGKEMPEVEKEEGDAKSDEDMEKPGSEAGYDDLEKGADGQAYVDATELVANLTASLQALAKSVTDASAANAADIAVVRAELQAVRAENAALQTLVGAGHLALAKLGESIVDPLVKSMTTRPAGVPAGTSLQSSPAAAAARMGTEGKSAPAAFSDEDLRKGVEQGVLSPDAAVKFKFNGVFSADAATDAAIREALNKSLKA